jgi:hypothetical protein
VRTLGQSLARRRVSRARAATIVVLLLGLAMLLLAPTGASAARAHVFKGLMFGGPGEGAGQLSLLDAPTDGAESPGSGVAVSDSSHQVFVADTGNRRVDVFTATGTFVMTFGRDVNRTAVAEARISEADVCPAVGHPEDQCQAGSSGAEPGQFEQPTYVAVDNNPSSGSFGDVYVGDPGDSLVSKFDAQGALVTGWGNNGAGGTPNGQLNGSPKQRFNRGSAITPLAGVAVGPQGNLWAFGEDGALFEFSPSGTSTLTCEEFLGAGSDVGGLAISEATAGRPRALVLDGFHQVVRTDLDIESGAVSEQEACGTSGIITKETNTAFITGFGLDSFEGDLYVDQEGTMIEDFASSCVPNARGCESGQVFGEAQLHRATGLAVDPGSGEIFVANGITDQIVVFSLAIEAKSQPPSEVTAASAEFHGTVNPVASELTRCVFEYGETTGYGASVPCQQSLAAIGQGDAPVEVNAPVGGLGGGRPYHYRLHATNGNGGVYTEDQSFDTSTTARVEEVTASGLTGATAILEAKVNPEGLPAHYHFEYGPCGNLTACLTTGYPGRAPATPAEDPALQAGQSSLHVSEAITGLSSATTYHYRVIVEDENGTATPAPEGTFNAAPSNASCSTARPAQDALLPDCRAFELVTPPLKNGAIVNTGSFSSPPLISEDGSTVLTKSIQCFGGPASCVGVRQREGDPYKLSRGGAGWSAEPLAPATGFAGSTMLTYNADTGAVLYALPAAAPALEQFYARQPDGELQPIGPLAETRGFPGGAFAAVASAPFVTTASLSRVVYQAGRVWPSLESGAVNETLFEYSGGDQSRPELVGVTGPAGSTSLVSRCGTNLGGSAGPPSAFGSLSADGRAVFFTARQCPGVSSDEIFERVEGRHGMETILVSGSGSPDVCGTTCRSMAPRDASFQGAAVDGSPAFFTDTGQLTDNASEDKRAGDSAFGGNPGCPGTAATSSGCNLYEFECPEHCEDTSHEHLVDVSAGDSSGRGPQVQGVLAIASNGADVYFVAHGVLTDGTNKAGKEPVPGGENLYAYTSGSEGATGHLAFVATLSAVDRNQWIEGIGFANATPDGRFLVFTSHKGLTSDVSRPEGPAQVYRYDAVTEGLVRVSIGSQGFNDDGNDGSGDAQIAPAERGFAAGDGPARPDPTMSSDGSFVFFESPVGLVPGALNDQCVTGNCPPEHTPGVLAENIYEWAADGARLSGSTEPCAEPSGCVGLISDGKDRTESNQGHQSASAVELQGVDATGKNVFFWTADQLVGQDTDSQIDLYDARVEGGFPEPKVSPPCGSIEECHPSPPPVPASEGSLGSQIFTGPGNLTPTLTKITPVAPKPKTAAQLRAAKLAAALKACKRDAKKARRQKCEKQARKRYGGAMQKKER